MHIELACRLANLHALTYSQIRVSRILGKQELKRKVGTETTIGKCLMKVIMSIDFTA